MGARSAGPRRVAGQRDVYKRQTQNSLSDNGRLRGRPTGFTITVRDFEIANGAGFLVALCGEIMRMPALPVSPNAMHIYLDNKGNVQGL